MAYDRARAVDGARRILEQHGWCVYEACVDVSRQVWEARAVIFDLSPDSVADALEREIEFEPEHDARLTGLNRSTLIGQPDAGAFLFYVSDGRAEFSFAPAPASRHEEMP